MQGCRVVLYLVFKLLPRDLVKRLQKDRLFTALLVALSFQKMYTRGKLTKCDYDFDYDYTYAIVLACFCTQTTTTTLFLFNFPITVSKNSVTRSKRI